jgi:phosphoenolpyruvate carboxykinase (GTP)
MDLPPGDLERLLTIDTARWRQEMTNREEHLARFGGLPEEIWAAHRRVAEALEHGAP